MVSIARVISASADFLDELFGAHVDGQRRGEGWLGGSVDRRCGGQARREEIVEAGSTDRLERTELGDRGAVEGHHDALPSLCPAHHGGYLVAQLTDPDPLHAAIIASV